MAIASLIFLNILLFGAAYGAIAWLTGGMRPVPVRRDDDPRDRTGRG